MPLKPAADPATFIEDASKVTCVYGAWPTFHDAEILGLELNRHGRLLLVRLWTFQVDRQSVDTHGNFKKINECVITFRFASIDDLSIEGFNHQNVVADIVFQLTADSIRVIVEGVFGVSMTFRCATVKVEGVVRCG